MNLSDQLKNMHTNHKFFSVKERKVLLKKLFLAICENEHNIIQALQQDLRKSEFEAYACEIAFIKHEIKQAIKNLNSWTSEQHVSTPLAFMPADSFIKIMPKGLVLILAPWNYPFLLSLVPFIGALAAGNSIVLKPSELAPKSAEIIKNIIKSCFDKNNFYVALGDVLVAKELLNYPFDHIFYTGNTIVGKEVMKAAAENLSSVTLELGGKSPVIIHESCDLNVAAKRIMWAKCLNAGQTCVAPDYIIIPKALKNEFITMAKRHLQTMFGDCPQKSNSYGRIISAKHFSRLLSYLSEGYIELGGNHDQKDLYIEPTILTNCAKGKIMHEEIFGPLLVLIEVDKAFESSMIIKNNPYPLALYLFAKDKKFINQTIESIPSGSVAINDCISQIAIPQLPFGGVRHSGLGNYHGFYSFKAFSNEKSVYHRINGLETSLRYPPYSKNKLKIVKCIL